MEASGSTAGLGGNDQEKEFCTTHWSVVQLAGQSELPQAAQALNTLCRLYWYPLYAYARRNGQRAEDAEDLVQAFFAQFLEKNYVARANRDRGKFRSFLLVSFKNFLFNEWARTQAAKRGGGTPLLSRDAFLAESRYAQEPRDNQTPDQAFDKSWAVATLERALTRLREEYVAAGKLEQFDCLKLWLWEEKGIETYADLAARLATTEAAIKMAVMRLRRRCRETIRQEVALTVAGPEEVDEELGQLILILRGAS